MIITKITDESQSSTDELVTGKSQTSHKRLQTSHRRVTDDFDESFQKNFWIHL